MFRSKVLTTLLLAAALGGCGSTSSVVTADPPGQGVALAPEIVARLDQAVDEQIVSQDLPSVVVSVRAPGSGDYLAVRGMADLETGAPRNIEDPFRIASVTKTFIATSIYILVDRGNLSVSDPISTWFPTFPRASEITVEDLLQMRSGIADSADTAFLQDYFANPLIDVTPTDMIARSAARANEFTDPGVETVYTNVNFVLLEQIVEMESGLSIEDFLSENIFGPLGMTHTFYPTQTNLPGGLRGYSYDAVTGEFVDKTVLNPAPAGGAGAIISTLGDLEIYCRAIGRGTLLTPATQAQRLQSFVLKGAPDFVRYGGGLEILGDFQGHNGTIFGFSTEMFYLPQHDATVIVSVNRLDENDQSQSTEIFLRVTSILFPDNSPWTPQG